jgi:DNA-binding GntR family transcriptional regulator
LTLLLQKDVTAHKLSELYSDWHNFDFHYQIALASGNRRLIDLLYGDIWSLMRLYRYPGALSPGRIPLGQADHEAILEALVAHDPDACDRLMRRHLAHAQENILHGPAVGEAAR